MIVFKHWEEKKDSISMILEGNDEIYFNNIDYELRTTLFVFLCFCATTVLRAERVDMLKPVQKQMARLLIQS